MANYNGYNGKRIVMRNVSEEKKKRMDGNPVYKYIVFKAIAGSDVEPVGVKKKPELAPEPKQEGADKAQPQGKTGE